MPWRSLKLADFSAALGLANFFLLSIWDELQDSFSAYYCGGPCQTWPIFARSKVCLLLFACFFWLLIACARYVRTPIPRKLAGAMLFASLLIGLDVVRVRILHIYSSSSAGLVGKAGAVLLAGATLYLLFYRDRILSRGILYASRFLAFAVPVNLAMTAWAVHTTEETVEVIGTVGNADH